MKKYYGLIGAGGYGREVMPLVRETFAERIDCGEIELFFVVEGKAMPESVNGIRLISLEEFKALPGPKYFNIAIGNANVRYRISQDCFRTGMHTFSIFSKNCVILDENKIGDGAIFSPFTTVTSNTKIGCFFHANIYSYIAHDCVIGDYVTFAPGVKCNGNVIIEDHVYIGTGAMIREGKAKKPMVIGHGAVIGMGAVVTKGVPSGITVVGNPAYPMSER